VVRLANKACFTQIALAGGRFFFENVTFKSFGALEFASGSNLKAFGGASASFDFWHLLYPLFVVI